MMNWGNKIRGWMGGNNASGVADLEERGLAAAPIPVTPYSAGGLDPNAAVPFYPPKPVAPPAQDIEAKRAAQKKANADQNALGLSGTANLMGFIQDIGEYKAELRGLQAMQIYEKMRRSNATVAALESAIRLPIRAADWQVRPGVKENEPGYALAKEIAEAAKENLFGGLESRTESGAAHTQTFESVIENALLAPVFGCAGHEDLWAIDGDKNRVRLRGLAPRLPLTFYQFLVEPDGETLKTLIQFGYRGALVQIVPVPAEKLALFTVNREGAYFYGRSILRAAYLHWYFNAQLYRIDAIACERNGMAVPWIEQGPNALPDDVSQSWQWVQNLTTNERSGLSTPNGWKFSLASPSGRPRDISTSIQHHNEQIMEAGLAGFLLLGRTQSGSRALGDTKLDFFLLSEEALARMIGEVITTTTLRRWCDLNYDFPAGKTAPYPRLTCGRIVVVNISDLVAAIKELSLNTVGALETSEERDNYLAERLGYPPISGAPRPKFAPVVRQIRELEQGDETIPDEGKPGNQKSRVRSQKSGVRSQESAARSQKKGSEELFSNFAALAEIRPNRPLKPFERKHNFAAHVERQDASARQVARLLRQAKPAAIRDAARQAAASRDASVVLPFDRALAQRIDHILDRAYLFGRDQVYAERYRATGRGKNVPPRQLAETKKVVERKTNPRFYVEATISDFSNWISSRARGAAVDLEKQGLGGQELERAIVGELSGASDGALDRMGDEAARSAVAGGRTAALGELQVEIETYVRSELMDHNTCDPCSDGDGTEWKSYDEIDWQPGDDCEGKADCRGQVIPVFEDEGVVTLE